MKEQNSPTPFYVNSTPSLPQFCLSLTASLPLVNLNLTSVALAISSHGLDTTVYRILSYELVSWMGEIARELSQRFESLALIGSHISPLKTQNLLLVDPAFVPLRFASRDWRSLA